MRKEHKWLWSAAAIAMAAGICMGCGAKSDGGTAQTAEQDVKAQEESTGQTDYIAFNVSQGKNSPLSMH